MMSLPSAKRRRKESTKNVRSILMNKNDETDSIESSPEEAVFVVKNVYDGSACESENDMVSSESHSGQKSPPSITLESGLEDFVYPMTKNEFLENCFRKRAVHVTCAQGMNGPHCERRVGALRKEMYDLNAEMILRHTSSDNIFLWLRQNDRTREKKEQSTSKAVPSAKTTNSNGRRNGIESKKSLEVALIHSVEISEVATAIALHEISGHPAYCRAPPHVEQRLVSNLLRTTGYGCGQYDPSGESIVSMGRGEVETFISTTCGHLTDWHFDFQENFTIQLSGIKRWSLQKGTLRDPVRGCTPHYACPEAVESQVKAAYLYDRKFRFGQPQIGINAIGSPQTIDVLPGDVLYFPAGMWHRVETIEAGVSINVSLMASNFASVTCQALQHLLLQDERWRMPLVNNSKFNAVDHLRQLLVELPDRIKSLERLSGNGAKAILPPVLRYPPKFSVASGEEGSWVDVEEDGQDGDDQSNSGIEGSDEKYFKENDEEKRKEHERAIGKNLAGLLLHHKEPTTEDEDDDDKDEDDDVDDMSLLDPSRYRDYPDDWVYPVKKSALFARNPLASLHRLDEIYSFYKDSSAGIPCQQIDHTNVFVLNVNYAGNEMHQSTVRVRFRDKCGISQRLLTQERKLGGQKGHQEVFELSEAEENVEIQHLIKFLVFHGYLLLIE